jgi:DNA-binding NtrC family response regulator
MKCEKPSILVVDADEGIRSTLKAVLEEEFFIFCAEDIWQAESMARHLILDVFLIDMENSNLISSDLKWISKSDQAILLTSTSSPSNECQEGAVRGTYGYISKPWHINVLRHLIYAATAQKRWERSQGLIQEFKSDWAWVGNS